MIPNRPRRGQVGTLGEQLRKAQFSAFIEVAFPHPDRPGRVVCELIQGIGNGQQLAVDLPASAFHELADFERAASDATGQRIAIDLQPHESWLEYDGSAFLDGCRQTPEIGRWLTGLSGRAKA